MLDLRLRGGILEMAASSLLFSLMSALVRMADGVDVWKTSLFRFAIGTAVLGTLALFRQIRLDFSNSRLLLLRGVLGGFGVFFYFLAINTLGLAKGTVISYTYPVFAVIGGALFLKDRVRPVEWSFMALSLAGLFLLSPGFFSPGPAGGSLVWYLLAVLGALISGGAIVCVKKPFSWLNA
jgi:drug/metabolite transporter (DMT)-like permease